MADKKISALTSASTPLAGTEVLPIVQSGSTVKVSVANLTAGRDIGAKTLALNTTLSAWAAPFDSLVELKDGVAMTSAYGVGFNPVNAYVGSGGWTYRNSSVATLYQNGAGTHEWSRAVSGTAGAAVTWISQLKTDSSDNVIAPSGNFVPATAAKGVNFTANTPAAGMTSQLLNWYEEGTWTPADGSGASLTFSSASGRYTRIGRAVHIICSFTYPSTANVSAAIISGLPFTTATPEGGLFLRYTDLASLAYVFPILTTTINVYTTSGNTVGNNVLSTKRIDLVGTYFV